MYLLPEAETYKSHITNSIESLQMFLEEKMEAEKETTGTNVKLILLTLMKNSHTIMSA